LLVLCCLDLYPSFCDESGGCTTAHVLTTAHFLID
jgi:hypothetical protein